MSKKSLHCFEIAVLCGDDTKMLLEIHILQDMPRAVTNRPALCP